MAGRPAGGGKAGLEALKEYESSKSDGFMQLCAMKGVRDEMGQLCLGVGRGRRILGTCKEMGNKPCT